MDSSTSGARERPTTPAVIARYVLIAASGLALINYLLGRFIEAEQTLYHADLIAYWNYARGLARLLSESPLQALKAVADSIATAELNLLPALPVATVMTWVGDSRAAYISTVGSLYGFTAVVAAFVAIRRLSSVDTSLAWKDWAGLTTLLFFATLWRPVCQGFIGVGGVGIAIVVFTIYFERPLHERRWPILALVGFLIAMLVFYRRWFGFWSVSFCLLVAGEAVWALRPKATWTREGLTRALRAPATIAIAAVITLATTGPARVMHILTRNYDDEFKAYQFSPNLAAKLARAVDEFGWVLLILVIVSLVGLLRSADTRRMATLAGLHSVVTAALFYSFQEHMFEHWYLYYPSALILVGVFLTRLVANMKQPRLRLGLATVATLTALLLTVSVYSRAATPVAERLGSLVPRAIRPMVRHDLDEVHRLLKFLDQQIAGNPGYVYVLGNETLISDQMLAYANQSLDASYQTPKMILSSTHFDRRDGFPDGLLTALYVIVAEPIQLQLPEHQRVIGIPAESFLTGTNIARAFDRSPSTFHLDGDVTVHVFGKWREIHPDEIAELSALLEEVYPDRPDIFRPRDAIRP